MRIEWKTKLEEEGKLLSDLLMQDTLEGYRREPLSYFDFEDLIIYQREAPEKIQKHISEYLLTYPIHDVVEPNELHGHSTFLHEAAYQLLSFYTRSRLPNLSWSPTSIYDDYGLWHEHFLPQARALNLSYHFYCYAAAEIQGHDDLNWYEFAEVCQKSNIDPNYLQTIFTLSGIDIPLKTKIVPNQILQLVETMLSAPKVMHHESSIDFSPSV